MANLKEQEKWEDGIYQIEENDPVLGGADGITNKPIIQLANRTTWLKKALELLTGKSKPKDLTADSASVADKDGHSHALPKSSTSQQGIVQLDDTWESDSREKAPTARVIKAMKQLIDSLTRNLSNYIPNSKKSNAVNSPSSETVATSAAAKTAFDKGVEALNKANQVDAATLKKNGNQSINGVLKAENVGNAWAAYKFGAKQGEWQIEVHPDSHTTGNRRFNMLWSPNGGNRVYLSFPHIGDGGETVAYQSWVNAELTKVRSLANQNSQNFSNYIHNNKKSNAVDSTSTDTLATSRAVKLALDRGTTALNTANSANTNATNANNNANTRASKRALTGDDLNNVIYSGIYGQNANVNATPQRHYPIDQAGMLIVTEYSGYGTQQLYAPYNAGHLYARGRNASNGWDAWKRIDGLDKVSKSGDTMTGNLTINHGEPRVHGNRNNSNNWYVGLPNGTSNNLHLHSYANNTSLVLESDKISTTKPVFSAGNRTAVSLSGHNIQFRWNNSGNLDLKIDNTELGQLHYTNQRYAVVTANNGDYAGLHIQRKGTSGNFWARAEALPDRRWKFATESGASVFMQNKSGTLALLEDMRNVNRRDYSRTIKGTNDWDNGKQKDIAISGQVITYPDGRIQQILHLKHFRMAWFVAEDHNIGYNQGDRGTEIFLQLWSAMPNRIVNIQAIASRSTNANTSAAFYNEAGEYIFGWNLRKQGNNKDRIWINAARARGGQDEHVDLYVVVEGY